MTVTVLAERIPYIKADAPRPPAGPLGDQMTFFPPELSSARDAGRNTSQCSASVQNSPSRWGWPGPAQRTERKTQVRLQTQLKVLGTPANRLGGSLTPGLRKLKLQLLHFNFYP